MQTDVIRRISIEATQKGVAETTDGLKKLSGAQDNVAIASDKQQKAHLSVAAALEKQQRSLDIAYRSTQQFEKAQRDLDQAQQQGLLTAQRYAELSGLNTARMNEQTKAANDNAEGWRLSGIEIASVANHAKQAAVAAYALSPAFREMVNPVIGAGLRLTGTALAAMGPTAAGVATEVGARMLPALALIARVALPIMLVVDAFRAMAAITELGAQKLKEFNDIAANAGAAGVSTDFFQRQAKGAEEFGLKTDAATAALKKFNEVSTEKLGGSDFEQRLDVLVKAGNFVNNSGVAAYKAATDAESRYRAVVDLITQAMDAGQRLAALDLAAKFLPPELLNQLRANGQVLREMQTTADNIKKVEIISPEQIGYAVELKRRLTEANDTIEKGLKPIQKDLTQLGLNYQESWVQIVELEAMAVSGLNTMYGWVKGIADVFTYIGNLSFWTKLTQLTGAMGLNSSPAGLLTPGQPGYSGTTGAGSSANTSLASGLYNPVATYQAMLKANTLGFGARRDTSIVPNDTPAASKDANDQVDRAINTLRRHVEQQKADTEAVGLGAAALARFRAEAAETSAIQANGGKITAEQAAEFEKLKIQAYDTAKALAEAKIASQIDFARKTAFLSQEDVAIAQQLSIKYGNDVPAALASSEAAAMRLNNSLKQVNDIVGTAASSISKDIANGVAPMEAFANAAKRAAESVLDIATKKIASNLLGGLLGDTASQATGATTAAGILTSAGATVAASMIAGATEAASILGLTIPPAAATLPAAGAVAGTEVAAGGVAAGAAIETGAFTLSAAMGPIAIAMAAIAAIAAVIGLSGGQSKADKWLQGQIDGMNQRSADYANRAAMVGVDPNTRQGAIAAQDAKNTQERIAENKAGGQRMNQLLQLQVQERNQLLTDWDKKDTDLLKQNADAKLAIEKAAADRSLGFQNRLFAATNDFSTLEGQLAAFDRAAQQDRLTEVQNGGQAIVDLEAAQAAERLGVIKKYNDQITAAAEQAAKAQLSAFNSAGKSVADYLNNLVSGPGSTSSPTATLSSAQSVYNANLALAIGGNVDAQSKFPQLADNLEKAARSVFASAQGYQDIKSQIISQGLALPAVQNATDPVVVEMRNVLAAINAGNAAQALDATLQGVIKSAIDAGNASAVASALLAGGKIRDDGLNFTDFVKGLGPQFANLLTPSATLSTQDQVARDRLQSVFNELDGNGNGILEKSEAIKGSSAVMSFNTLAAADRAKITADSSLTIIGTTAGTNAGVGTNNTLTGTGNSTLDAIRGLQDTANTQLGLLRLSLSPTVISKTFSGAGGTGAGAAIPGLGSGKDYILQNQVVDALNKIVLNTYLLTQNTAYTDPSPARGDDLKGHGYIGVYAQGGWITGGIPGRDSVPIMAMQDEFIINRNATRALTQQFGAGVMDIINTGRLPFNDNRPVNVAAPVFRGGAGNSSAELLARIDKLTAEVKALREENTKVTIGTSKDVTRAIRDTSDDQVEATDENGKRVAYAITSAAKDNKAA